MIKLVSPIYPIINVSKLMKFWKLDSELKIIKYNIILKLLNIKSLENKLVNGEIFKIRDSWTYEFLELLLSGYTEL